MSASGTGQIGFAFMQGDGAPSGSRFSAEARVERSVLSADDSLVTDIRNKEALVTRFGRWPSFHDAEVLAVRLDSGQLADGCPGVELDIHLFEVDGVRPDGAVNYTTHTLATLLFEDTDQVEIEDFGQQNVLDDLLIEAADSTGGTRVTMPSNNGLSASFICQRVSLTAVEPFTPGPNSVYHRPSS